MNIIMKGLINKKLDGYTTQTINSINPFYLNIGDIQSCIVDKNLQYVAGQHVKCKKVTDKKCYFKGIVEKYSSYTGLIDIRITHFFGNNSCDIYIIKLNNSCTTGSSDSSDSDSDSYCHHYNRCTGKTGATGATGLTGATGPPGKQGPRGFTGMGETGDTGATGCTGSTGSRGTQGPQGPRGFNGETGATGATGSTGAAGSFSGIVAFTGGTPIPSATTIDNYSLSEQSFFQITGTVASNINGFANGISGRFIIIVNNSTKNQTFVQEQISSTASNRFILGVSNKTIGINQSITFIYATNLTVGGVAGQSRWVMTSTT